MAEPGIFWGRHEPARVTNAKKTSLSVFDNYYWRGPSFINFCLYEYFKLVTVKPMAEETSHDIQFLPEHPNYESKIQCYTGKRPADTYTVALTGPLSENQPLEDGIHGGHPETEAMQNDLALILLTLLVP